MHIRNEECFLPTELLVGILMFAVKSEFKDILSFRLVTQVLKDVTDDVSRAIFSELFGANISSKVADATKNVPRSLSFFKFSQFEASRLSSIHQNPVILSDIPIDALIITKKCIKLPPAIRLPLTKLVSLRGFELIKELFEKIKDKPNINQGRLIDHVYLIAAEQFNVIEFVQLMEVLPIDINRSIGCLVKSWEMGAVYVKSSLVDLTINNPELMNYLIERGASNVMLGFREKHAQPNLH